MRIAALAALSAFLISAGSASAETISTHVLDLARGVGGRDVPVTLAIKDGDGGWRQLATARTDENGRVRSFGDQVTTQVATYKLTFDMSQYGDKDAQPFFPEIDVVFQVRDPSIHYHVPVVVSPYATAPIAVPKPVAGRTAHIWGGSDQERVVEPKSV